MTTLTNQNAQDSKLLSVSDSDIALVTDLGHARNWISMCGRSPVLMQKFQGLFVVAQLTMLAHGLQPECA